MGCILHHPGNFRQFKKWTKKYKISHGVIFIVDIEYELIIDKIAEILNLNLKFLSLRIYLASLRLLKLSMRYSFWSVSMVIFELKLKKV